MSQLAGFSHLPGTCAGDGFAAYDRAAARWPSLPSRPVSVGGVTVTCAQARAAAAALAVAGGIAVRQVLAAAGSPLAACDYHAAARPYLDRCSGRGGRGRGAAGRPVTRMAFLAAVAGQLERAAAAEPGRVFAADLARARHAFARDFGYAEQMARAAGQVAARQRAAALRAQVRAGDSARASERAA